MTGGSKDYWGWESLRKRTFLGMGATEFEIINFLYTNFYELEQCEPGSSRVPHH